MTRYPLGPLAISLGDPAGIGAEVIAKCWDNRARFELPPFVAIGDPRAIAAVWDGPLAIIDDLQEADQAFDVGLPIIQLAAAEADVPGHPSVAGRCGVAAGNVAMMLAGPTLRTVPVTTHLPLATAVAALTSSLIESRGKA